MIRNINNTMKYTNCVINLYCKSRHRWLLLRQYSHVCQTIHWKVLDHIVGKTSMINNVNDVPPGFNGVG